MPKPSASRESSHLYEDLLVYTSTASDERQRAADDTAVTANPVRPIGIVLEDPIDIILESRAPTIPDVVEDYPQRPGVYLRVYEGVRKCHFAVFETPPENALYS